MRGVVSVKFRDFSLYLARVVEGICDPLLPDRGFILGTLRRLSRTHSTPCRVLTPGPSSRYDWDPPYLLQGIWGGGGAGRWKKAAQQHPNQENSEGPACSLCLCPCLCRTARLGPVSTRFPGICPASAPLVSRRVKSVQRRHGIPLVAHRPHGSHAGGWGCMCTPAQGREATDMGGGAQGLPFLLPPPPPGLSGE